MIKSFFEFINENANKNSAFIKRLCQIIIDKIRTHSMQESEEYTVFSGMEFTEPFVFDLILKVRKDNSPQIEKDSHFNSLPWEEINFKDLGYCIDANVMMNKSKIKVPTLTLHMIINTREEPMLYNKLYYRLIDILTHETNHLNQLGMNRHPFNSQVSDRSDREEAKKSYRYFLLNDEIESMIEGMYERSKAENIPLDQVFDNYLNPFIESNYISQKEYDHVMTVWVTRSAELYPDATFSNNVDHIINSI